MERRATSTSDARCRLTNFRRGVQTSNIIPSMEKSWFVDNAMDQYGVLDGRTGQDVVDLPPTCSDFGQTITISRTKESSASYQDAGQMRALRVLHVS